MIEAGHRRPLELLGSRLAEICDLASVKLRESLEHFRSFVNVLPAFLRWRIIPETNMTA